MPDSDALDLKATVQRTPETVDATVDDDVVTMSVESGKYFVMDPIAGRIWRLIEEPIVVEDICRQLLTEYEVDARQCQQDVLSFLNELLSYRMIRRVSREMA